MNYIQHKYKILVVLFFVGLVVSGIQPHDYFTWILEVFPAILGFIILWTTFRKFQFSDTTYWFILLHSYILFVGGHYTYAEEPLFDWIKEVLHQNRNNYDKIGHFAQGFVPAMIIRELLIRKNIVQKGFWMSLFVLSFCLGFSALYELFEWWVAEASGQSAEAFLGTQGYIWDTQSDMLIAFIGAITMLVCFGRFQNMQVNRLMSNQMDVS